MTYGKRTLIAVDQLINTLLGGWPDETLSSRAYRMAVDGHPWLMRAIDGLAMLFGDKNHCEASFDCLRAYEGERKRLQCPPELRK